MEPITMAGLAIAALLGWVSYMCLRHEVAMSVEYPVDLNPPGSDEFPEEDRARALIRMVSM